MGDVRTESIPDEAYYDRDLLAQALARMALEMGYKAGVRFRDTEWPIIYVDLPTGQVSWHIKQEELLQGLPDYPGEWDNHGLKEKRGRVKEYAKGNTGKME